MRALRRLASAALVVAACAHRPAPPPAPSEPARRVWPTAPAQPRARLVGVLPDPSAPPPARRWWQVLFSWITGGDVGASAREGLVRPFGVGLSADGALLVADPDAGRVLRFDAKGVPSPLSCPGLAWSAPMAVLGSAGGEILVADAGLPGVVRMRGRTCELLGGRELERPTGLVLDGDRILVADPPRHQIVVLGPDGGVLGRWGEQGEGDGKFAFPTSIAAAPDGTFLVTDALNFRVVRLAADGRWLSAFGTPGEEGAQFARPKGIAADESGRVYVSDAQRDVILVFDARGEPEYSIGEPGEAPGQLALPSGLAIAPGRLYVADSQNRRIQVFELLGGTP